MLNAESHWKRQGLGPLAFVEYKLKCHVENTRLHFQASGKMLGCLLTADGTTNKFTSPFVRLQSILTSQGLSTQFQRPRQISLD